MNRENKFPFIEFNKNRKFVEFENYGVHLYNNESELDNHTIFDYKGHRDNLPKEIENKLIEDFRLKYSEEWIVLMMK